MRTNPIESFGQLGSIFAFLHNIYLSPFAQAKSAVVKQNPFCLFQLKIYNFMFKKQIRVDH